MGFKYRTGDRTFGGSMEPRLNPGFGGERLNEKLGPGRPSPLVRETSGGCVYEAQAGARRRLIGLPAKFERES
jgi:hypothetical protein